MKKYLIVLVISLSLTCLLFATEKNVFNREHYLRNYLNNSIVEETGKNTTELMKITDDLLLYLKGKAGDKILEPNFNQREILHMRDVQVLFKYGFILKYISLIVSIVIILYFSKLGEKELLGKWMFKGLFFNWLFIALLGIMIYFDFSKYFTYFHYVFFTNDLWLLDPNTDLLIQMLPEEFFNNMAIDIGVSFFSYLATIQGIGYAVSRKGRVKNEKKYEIFKRKS